MPCARTGGVVVDTRGTFGRSLATRTGRTHGTDRHEGYTTSDTGTRTQTAIAGMRYKSIVRDTRLDRETAKRGKGMPLTQSTGRRNTDGTCFRLIAAAALCASAVLLQGSVVAQAPVPATQVTASDLSLRVVDRRKRVPLAHRKVFIYADNGVRCIKAPCNTNGAQWEGKTDAKGNVTVPGQFRLASMLIWAEGYGAYVDLINDAVRIKPNSWRIALRRDR